MNRSKLFLTFLLIMGTISVYGNHEQETKTLQIGRLAVNASAKTLTVMVDGEVIFEFPANIAVDSEFSNDEDMFKPGFTIEKDQCHWRVQSSNWEKKEYSLSVEGQAIVLKLKITGNGKVGKVRYFPENSKSGQKLKYEVFKYFVPVALGGADALPQWRNTMENASIELNYFSPPLLAFPFTGNYKGACTIGLAPKADAYNIDHFRCEFGSFKAGLFSTDFYGYTEVNGEYELPAITFTLGKDEYESLALHSNWLYDFGGCRKTDRSETPRWWLGPVFCGWGEQKYMEPDNVFAASNQRNYEIMSDRLDELGLEPAFIIVDDKWQNQYGTLLPDSAKWKDMRSFVDKQHAKGRRVLLWVKTWDNEGLPSEESVKSLCTPYGADPTSPEYRKRIKETIYRLLSSDPGCFNCDGFKIDFANCMPLGKNLQVYEKGTYGIELLKRMMSLIYESAKAAKPDCLINTSCAHPYFAEVTDQCRLHDYDGRLRYLWHVREFRAKLFQAAIPNMTIDTDDPYSTSLEQSMDYLRRAPSLGIPVLYSLHGTEQLPMTETDFKEVARIWKEYNRRIDQKYASGRK